MAKLTASEVMTLERSSARADWHAARLGDIASRLIDERNKGENSEADMARIEDILAAQSKLTNAAIDMDNALPEKP